MKNLNNVIRSRAVAFRSIRVVLVLSVLMVVAGFGAASAWNGGFDWLSIRKASAESKVAATAPKAAAPLTFGVCDTAGPIEVESSTGTAGGTPTAYATLGAAFTAINGGTTHTGVITIDVCGDTNELAASAVLSGATSSYSTITISPAGGLARTITGAPIGGVPMIDFDGADNVDINGVNSGGNTLTIVNTTVSATAATSTIRYINDASSNIIQNATVNGAATGASTGTILYSNTTGATGNDNNTVTASNIGPNGATFPSNAIFSSGTTTSATTRNSGVSITSNNIFDFYNAGAVVAGGVNLAGSTDWTITGNSFYQTASRAQIAGGGYIVIGVADTTGVNFIISNNFIGGSTASAGGTAWTETGATTHTFIGIRMSVGSSVVSSLQNNTIQNINNTTSSTSTINAGISAVTGAMNVGTTTGNTIGATTGTGSIVWTAGGANQFSGILAGTGTPNGINISNNRVGSITTAGASVTTLYGIRIQGAATAAYTVSGNTIGSTTTANSITSNAAGSVVGISGTQTLFPATVSNNTIQNLQSTSTGTASLRGIELTGSISGQTISGNTIANFSTTSTSTGTTGTASLNGIVLTGTATSSNNITSNTIRDLANTTAGATAVYNNGITITSTPGTTMSRNLIYNLTTASTSTTSSIQGIYLFNSSATENIYNNMIRLGTGVGNNPIIRGIRDNTATSSPTNIIHNSIFIDGTQGAATVNTNCIVRDLASTMTITDNILWNNRASTGAPGAQTGRHYGIQNTSTTGTFASNFNDIYTPNNGGAVGQSSALDRITLANWQTATSQDANSFSLDPQFIDATNATTPNLHIHPTNATIIESNGTLVGAPTDDFDGQTRASFTPVDIGADAGNFTGIDLSAPIITYTAFGTTSLTTNRTLSVTLTDVTGVATGGLAPRIYFNKNAGANSSTACTLASGTVNNGVWDCTIDYTPLGGVIAGDAIRYFVVAQDTLGNLASNPSAGFTGTNVNTVTTPPTTPNLYMIGTALSGTYSVGVAGDFNSLTNAGGVFDNINVGALTGNVIIEIITDLTGETGAVALNPFAEDGFGGYTMLIKPSGAPRTISGIAPIAVIRLNGADRVRIDGSTASSFAEVVGGTPALRELTVRNDSTSTSSAVIAMNSNTDGAQDNTIQNVNVDGNSPVTTLLGIHMGGAANGSGGTDNDGNDVINCRIRRTYIGIFSSGAIPPNQNIGTRIEQNDMSNVGADRIFHGGILVFNEDGIQIIENNVGGIDNTGEGADAFGIGVGTQNADIAFASSGGVVNANVTRNRVNGVSQDATFSAFGIGIAGGNNGPNTVSNNMVTGVIADANAGDIVAGIFVVGTPGSETRLFHNSVSMTGVRSALLTPGTAQYPSYGIAITGADPIVALRNNIFYTTQTTDLGANPAAFSYGIGMQTTTFVNLDSDYNAFWSTGANDMGFRSGSLSISAGTNYATVGLWSTAITNDVNSAILGEADPMYINPLNDLHLDGLTTPLLGDASTPIFLIDFDSDPRPSSASDIGADEIVQAEGFFFPAGTFYNALFAGGDITFDNVTITNRLYLTGAVNGSGFLLTIGCGATVIGAGPTSFYHNGGLVKNFCTTETFSYPVGTTNDGPEYSPATVTGTALGTNPSSLTVQVFKGSVGGLNDLTSLDRFWNLTESGDLTATLLFNYLQTDVDGDETTYRVVKVDSGVISFPEVCPSGPCVDEGANTFNAPGVTEFSSWTAAEPLAPTNTTANIGGHVVSNTGAPLAGVTMNLLDTVLLENRTTVTDANGNFFFSAILTGRQIVVTPSRIGYTFDPSNRVFSHTGELTNVNFTGTPDSSQQSVGSDFDGDGKADLSVFRPSDATWYTLYSSTNTLKAEQWGLGTDRIAPADYDGDHVTDIAVFRPSNGMWYINQSATGTLRAVNWGVADDVITPADFDGDGQADIAVWRPSTGTWYVIQSTNGQTRTVNWGANGDRPVAADYDGDGKADMAVWRPSNGLWYVLKSSDGSYQYEHWGIEEDRPVVGDYDGDNKSDLAVFRPTTSTWYVKYSSDASTNSRGHGTASDVLVPGDYDGDGKTDRAVWQLGGDWNILRSTTNTPFGQKWGTTGDIPTTSAYVR